MALYSLRPKRSIATSTPKIPKIKPAAVVRAVSVRHWRGKPTQEQRAERAANWLNGELLVLPTLSLACSVFGTNYAAVVKARRRPGNRPKSSIWLGLLSRAWMNCSDDEQAAFARAFEPGLWRALEHVVDHHN
jgi:hypothetical protein